MKILNISQMQKAERDCAAFGITLDNLMENAGKAFAQEVNYILKDVRNKNILVLVGPGNNGGDGLVAARYFHDWGAKVDVYLCGKRPENDANLEKIEKRSVNIITAGTDSDQEKLTGVLSSSHAVIDAVFGTGKSRPLQGIFSQVLNTISEAKKKNHGVRIIALDLPSGLDADTGGIDPACPFVDDTITLGFPKIGLFNFPGAERAGKITIVDIGIPQQVVDYIKLELLTDDNIKPILPARPLISNKGSFGKVLVIAGSINYVGAAYLASSGVIRVGAGMATLATPLTLQAILATKLAEVTYLALPESAPGIISSSAFESIRGNVNQYDTLLMGCGLGQSPGVIELVQNILLKTELSLPSVLDADALNILAKVPDWWHKKKREAILTPHPGEMARLTGKSIADIQSDRIETARHYSSMWNKTVVLKGAYTVIASPDGRVAVCPLANPGLASAGTGDVLAGAIAGMLAQKLSPFEAACCGVYLHGQAGELVKKEMGDAGMLASDLLPKLPLAIRQLKGD
jgi:ADP-dependent NAD(P)H-hydrate dehydratase / NAD(P)H-hydrate epimerase